MEIVSRTIQSSAVFFTCSAGEHVQVVLLFLGKGAKCYTSKEPRLRK